MSRAPKTTKRDPATGERLYCVNGHSLAKHGKYYLKKRSVGYKKYLMCTQCNRNSANKHNKGKGFGTDMTYAASLEQRAGFVR